MDISANPSTNTNLAIASLQPGVERVSTQHLEETEDISVELLTADEVRTLLLNDQIKQALMAAPLWKYFAVNGLL